MKKNNIFLIFIKMFFLFLIYEIISDELYPIISRSILYGRFGREFIIEMSCVLLATIVILVFKNSYVFYKTREKFSKSLLVGGYMIGISIMSFVINIFAIGTIPKVTDLLSLIFFCLSIGVMEELLCRGWIQNEFIEKYGDNQKQVIISILCSSLIFGGMHISNIWVGGQGVIETIAQIIQAVGAGFLLGCIYYRTQNIWANAFIHGFWDFALYLPDLYTIKECTEGTITKSYLISILIISTVMSIIYILIGIYIVRKNKIKELVKETYNENQLKQSEKNIEKIIFIIIMLYFCLSNIPSYDNPEICYSYDEKNITYDELSYPTYTSKIIEYNNKKYEIKIENNTLIINDINNSNSTEFSNKTISNFLLIKNNTTYTLLVLGLNEYQTDTKTYYAYFDEKELDTEDFIINITKSLKELEEAPTVSKIGYITDTKNNTSYVLLESYKSDYLILSEDKLYILK